MITLSKWNRLFIYFDEHVCVFLPSMCAVYPIHLTCLYLVMLVTFVASFKAQSPPLCDFLCRALPSFRTIYSPQHPVLENPQFMSCLYEEGCSKHQVNYSLRPIYFSTEMYKIVRNLGLPQNSRRQKQVSRWAPINITRLRKKENNNNNWGSDLTPGIFFFARVLLYSFYGGGWWWW